MAVLNSVGAKVTITSTFPLAGTIPACIVSGWKVSIEHTSYQDYSYKYIVDKLVKASLTHTLYMYLSWV